MPFSEVAYFAGTTKKTLTSWCFTQQTAGRSSEVMYFAK